MSVVGTEPVHITFGISDLTLTAALNQGQDPDQCVPFVSYHEIGADNSIIPPRLVEVEVFSNAGTPTVRATRGTSGDNCSLHVTAGILEMSDGVQKLAFSLAAGTASGTVACTTVNQAYAFLIPTFQAASNAAGAEDFDEFGVNVRFSANNQVTFEREGAATLDFALSGTIYVVEDLSESLWTVQRFDMTMLTGSQTQTTAVSTVDTTKSFIVGFVWSQVNDDNCSKNAVRLDLQDSTTVRAFKESASAGDPKIGGFVVSMTGGSVQRGLFSFPASGTDNADRTETISAVDASRSLAHTPLCGFPVNGANPSTAEVWGDLDESIIATYLASSTQVTLERFNAFAVAAEASWEVIEFAVAGGGDPGPGGFIPRFSAGMPCGYQSRRSRQRRSG